MCSGTSNDTFENNSETKYKYETYCWFVINLQSSSLYSPKNAFYQIDTTKLVGPFWNIAGMKGLKISLVMRNAGSSDICTRYLNIPR